jgi:hypothetical protein
VHISLWGRRLLKAAVALGITGYLLWASDPAAVLAAARHADWRWILAALALVLLDRALNAWRWIALLDDSGLTSRLPTTRLLYIFFVSTFLGTFLPASGDLVVRAWHVSREQPGRIVAIASVVMDRLLGVVGLVLVVAAGLVMGRGLIEATAWRTGVILSAIIVATALAVVYSRTVETLLHTVGARLPSPLIGPASKLLRALRAFSTRHATVTGVLLLSIVVNVIRVLQAWMLGRAVGLDAGAGVYLALVPLILLLMLLPISVAGLGVSQAGFVGLFTWIGFPAAPVFALSVLYVALGVLGNLPGAVLYLTGAGAPPTAGPPARAGESSASPSRP